MNEQPSAGDDKLALEYQLDAAPDKVWRALKDQGQREKWLPSSDLATPDIIAEVPGREIRFRLRDNTPPFIESTVTFVVSANDSGGTTLKILQEIADPRFIRRPKAANGNAPPTMLAA